MTPVDLISTGAALLLALAPVAIFLGRAPFASAFIYGASGLLSAFVAVIGLMALVGQNPASSLTLPLGLPWIGSHLAVDALASFFVFVVGFGGAVISLYAIGYGRHEAEPQRILPFYPGFLGAMLLVVLADDAFTFLLCWEVMSLLSWALVLSHHRADATQNAGYVYLVMAGFGTLSMLLAFGLLAGPGGDYTFEAMRSIPRTSATAYVVLVLMLLGAGSKAGIAPLHVWLPLAHPAAPSHVSALMSGVMTKVALYGFIRVIFDLLGPLDWWASPLVILLGAMTAVLGILFALMENDIKRVLAYSTIENIGVIFAALGLAMAFRANHMPALAALAFTAALFHIFNHMVFKSLLFMASGAVLNATGLKDLDQLGGLIRKMPVTSFLTLIGVTAISALPPFSGFASEWLVFQAILKSPELPQTALQYLVPATGGLLALAAALAAACFARLYGIGFLGRARSDAAQNATDVDRFSLTAMSIMAGLCLLAGIFPGFVLDILRPVASAIAGGRLSAQIDQSWVTIFPVAGSQNSYSGLLVLLFVTTLAGAAAWLIHRLASEKLRRAPAWDCGFPNDDPMTQYSAASFAQPVRRALGTTLMHAREDVMMPQPGDPRPATHVLHITDLVWRTLYEPVSSLVLYVSTGLNRMQFLTIRRYLSLVFLSLIFLLLVLTIWN